MRRSRRDLWIPAWVGLWSVAMAASIGLSWRSIHQLPRLGPAEGEGVTLQCRSSIDGRSDLYRVSLSPPRIQRLRDDGTPWHTFVRVERVGDAVVAFYSYHQGEGTHNDQLRFRGDLSGFRNDTIWIRPDEPGRNLPIPPADQGRCQRWNG